MPTPEGASRAKPDTGELKWAVGQIQEDIKTILAKLPGLASKDDVKKLSDKIDCITTDISTLQREGAVREVRIDTLDKDQESIRTDVEKIKAENRWWSGANSIMAIIAGALGIFKP